MAENVVALPGFAVPRPANEPDMEIVDVLERLLSEARAGTLVGLAYATVRRNPICAGSGWHSDQNRYDLMAAVMMLNHRISRAMVDD